MLTRIALVALVAAFAGCTTFRIAPDARALKVSQRQVGEIASSSATPPDVAAAANKLIETRRGSGASANIPALIAAARLALPDAMSNSASSTHARTIYNLAVERLVAALAENHFSPDAVAGIHIAPADNSTLDPRSFSEILVSREIRLLGLRHTAIHDGVGAALVGILPPDSPSLVGEPGIPRLGLSLPVNAILTFPNRKPTLTFSNALRKSSMVVNGRPTPLAADFSAALATLVARGHASPIDIRAMFLTRKYIDEIGLFQIEPYDPKKIPVVLVHGLLSRPEAWTAAVNQLYGDPFVRKTFQFWLYLYPTGLPVWASTAKLRMELDRFQSALASRPAQANRKRVVIIGHSMGGLISSLLVRQGGNPLWEQFFDNPPDSIRMTPEARRIMNAMFNFSPRNDITRAVFVATPHRGSTIAVRPAINLIASLIQLPVTALDPYRRSIIATAREDVRDALVAPANSIRFLRANSPLLQAILALPMANIPYHSIIGDRGLNNTPHSSDGVVPYWSSHLEGASSEKIVPSGHGANEHPAGIEEIRRILTEHAKN